MLGGRQATPKSSVEVSSGGFLPPHPSSQGHVHHQNPSCSHPRTGLAFIRAASGGGSELDGTCYVLRLITAPASHSRCGMQWVNAGENT